MLNLVSIFSNDFVSFGSRLGYLLALFWEPLEGLGASLCRQVGAKGGQRGCQKRSWRQSRSKSLLGPHFWGFGTLWDLSWNAFWQVLGNPWGAKWEPKGFKKGAKRLWRPNRCKSPLRFNFWWFGRVWDLHRDAFARDSEKHFKCFWGLFCIPDVRLCSETVHSCLRRVLVQPRCSHDRASRSHVKKFLKSIFFALGGALRRSRCEENASSFTYWFLMRCLMEFGAKRVAK